MKKIDVITIRFLEIQYLLLQSYFIFLQCVSETKNNSKLKILKMFDFVMTLVH